MCGRYILYTDEEQREIRRIINEVNEKHNVKLKKGDIYPSQIAPVYKAGMDLDVMTWGYKTHYSKNLLINARSETVLEKPTFRSDFLQRRCLIPAAGFYEWDSGKNKFMFKSSTTIMYMGGFYQQHDDQERFVIMTKAPVEPVKSIHDRMPVIIPVDRLDAYLSDPDAAEDLMGDYSVKLKKLDCGDKQLSLL